MQHKQFLFICKSELGIAPVSEHKFHPTRKWRFDFAFPDLKIAVEVEGGIFSGGRHTRGAGYTADMEKYNQAALLGWMLFRFSPSDLQKTKTYKLLKEAIDLKLLQK